MRNSIFIEELTEDTFSQRVLQSERPVLLAVCGGSGGPDEELLTLLQEWALESQGRLGVFQLSPERASRLSERHRIYLPAGLALFSQGALCYRFIGQVSRRDLDDLLARASLLRGPGKDTDRPEGPTEGALQPPD